jgi:molecular chaperone GrpE (heat shock protein)
MKRRKPMSIEEMIKNGATPEEINAAMQEIYLEKEREDKARAQKEQEALLRKLAEQEHAETRAEEEARKEMLKREARAYIINGMLAYLEAFDLLEEGEEPDEDDIKTFETYLMQMESYLPIAKEIAKLQEEQKDKFGEGFNFGLFGGPFGGGL